MRRGFTILEVLVSLTICLGIAGICTAGFFQARSTMDRVQARVALHDQARMVHERVYQTATATQQHCALYLEAQAESAPGAGDGWVRLICMRGKYDHLDFTDLHSYGKYLVLNGDLQWSELRWDQSSGNLTEACSSLYRSSTIGADWIVSSALGNRNFKGWGVFGVAQPRRAAGTDPATRLADNHLFSPTLSGDQNDYADLTANRKVLIGNVGDLALQALAADGTVRDVSLSAPGRHCLDGMRVDGGRAAISPATPPAHRRPLLLRLRLAIAHPATALRQTFSFSFPLPGLAPHF